MTDNDRLVLHGSFTSSSSYKPMLFLALAGLPFSFRTVNLKNGVQKQPAHLAINRYGQVPVLQHRGLTLVMSNVILDYLARTTGHFEGVTEQERWRAREWLSWENDAITNVARVRHFARFRPDVDRQIVDYFKPGAEAALDFVDKSLAGRQWLVGERCTIADLGCFGRLVFMAEGGMSLDARPNARSWWERIAAMPGFALPYDLIPKKDTEIAGRVSA
jgi:glutathione S-transferase